jgi:hypothetical protein
MNCTRFLFRRPKAGLPWLIATGIPIAALTAQLVAAETKPELYFGSVGVSIRYPASKIVWAATNQWPSHASVVIQTNRGRPLLDVRLLLSDLGVAGANRLDPLKGEGEVPTEEGAHHYHYRLGHGYFSYSFQPKTHLDWSRPDPPSTEAIRDHLLGLLTIAGFPTNELARSDAGGLRTQVSEGTTSGWNPAKQARDTRQSTRGIGFLRAIDGIDVRLIESKVSLEYHLDRIARFGIEWPVLATVVRQPVADRQQVLRWLAEGRCSIQDVQTTGMRHVGIGEIQSVRVTDVRMGYWKDWTERFEWDGFIPMLYLDVELTLGPGDVEQSVIYAPAVEFGLPPASESSSQRFGIFPSRKLTPP